MLGGGYLNSHATPSRWYYNTWNYYLNITFFPWLEVAYTCTIFDEWIRGGKLHMKNQDRSFHARLRLWKEGWWEPWTPQIVAGVKETSTLNKLVNELNIIAEYDSKSVNVGGRYTLWKDHINIVGELYDCKYPSVGVYF